jgi:ATP diphosphatase
VTRRFAPLSTARKNAARKAPARRRRSSPGEAFDRLVAIMAALRGPRGCAWDRRQTHQSLRGHMLEEAFEAADAIDRNDLDALPGELGDVLLQCIFHAQMAREAGHFDITTVIEALASKLIARHPHVFAPDGRLLTRREQARYRATTPEAVREQWARLKAAERGRSGGDTRVLSGIPRALPALLRAHKIGGRAASVGFDWPETRDVLAKIEEEVAELREAFDQSPARARDEMGDVLFSMANLARRLGIDAEAALSAANDKFTERFNAVEVALEAKGRTVHNASLEELEAAWQRVKAGRRLRASSGPSTPGRGRRPRPTQSGRRRRGRS